MSKLKGIRDMSAEVVKSTSTETEEVKPVKVQTLRTKRKLKHVGYGNFSPTVIMQDGSGSFVRVNRDDVLKKLDAGWKTVNRKTYKEAVRGGATAAAVVEKVSKKRKRK